MTIDEIRRYSRHLALPGFLPAHQEKLRQARVLVVGAGGLGSPLLLYLAAAGVGTLGIADPDQVDLSNLQRQILYHTPDIGQPKAQTAADRIRALNPHCEVVVHPEAIDRSNALEIISQYDLVADGSDNFPTRYLVNDACVLAGKPLVFASVYRFEGQIAVFNLSGGPNYRDLFPTPPPPELIPNCAEGGVLGVLPGVVGAWQAAEVIKIITGIGEVLAGKMMLLDLFYNQSRVFSIPKNPDLIITELPETDWSCPPLDIERTVDQLDGSALLLDIREPWERTEGHIPGDQVWSEDPPTGQTVIFYCRSGIRSLALTKEYRANGRLNVFSLKGGFLEWKKWN